MSGYVAASPLVANSHVKAGDVLVRLDDSDYRVAVRQAAAKVATQDSTIARLGKQVDAQAAIIDQAKAQLLSAVADEARAAADFNRTAKLANSAFAASSRWTPPVPTGTRRPLPQWPPRPPSPRRRRIWMC